MNLPSPYSVTKRRPLTNRQRLQMFLDAGGICCICGHKIDGVREMWDEHVIALADGGSNAMSNRGPAHERCTRPKTAKEATERARGRSFAERHYGAARPKRPMPGSRLSKWKRKLNGEVVLRDGGEND